MKSVITVRNILIASSIWIIGFFCWNAFSVSPWGKTFWTYNNDAKGPALGTVDERTWACPAWKGGYWPCTPMEGLEEAARFFPLAVIASFFTPLAVFDKNVTPGQAVLLFLQFPPLGIVVIFLLFSQISKAVKFRTDSESRSV